MSGKSSTATGSKWSTAKWILLAVLTSTLLTGCWTPAGILVIDERLTVPCDRPELRGPTNRDFWVWGIEQQEALADCADRMDLIRGLGR